ncbi:acyltransferase family protein [Acetobacter oeni]|uniref:Acyltransferase n=1 Tax=Acetobacter oeni TaxID=304077 RepID=A0A511XQZ7_9PROT|nr:acyltransferase [Acetobacter oeni]MBB3884966.1 peptidoglycan/LPS O-acetylase OafA/YrhL [Acetobacter oeni]NHO20839.1 acyltransferase family protein [Acetobacter oeni]GEN65354.1 acyltransferase [Acetobacter oeni]
MRIRSLDALRGIAALIVVLHHAALSVPGLDEQRRMMFTSGYSFARAFLYLTPLRLFVAGPSMVILFFVLSGVVLGMTFVDRDGQKYFPFIIKRVIRIWVPFALIILFSFFGAHLLGTSPLVGATDWFNQRIWGDQTSVSSLVKHLMMLGTQTYLDNPMWSLIVEMRASVVFPLLVVITMWNWRLALAATWVFGAISASLTTNGAWGIKGSLLTTCAYLFTFVLGIYIARDSKKIRNWFERRTSVTRISLMALGLTGLCFYPDETDVIRGLPSFIGVTTCALSAALVIMLAIASGRSSAILSARLPQFLGRISYSLYLGHVVIICIVCRQLAAVCTLSESVVVAVFLSVAFAWGFNITVEVPVAKFSKRVGKYLSKTTAPAVLSPQKIRT